MLNQLQAICNKYEELCARSEQPDFYADPQKAAKQLREKSDLEPIVACYQAYRQAEKDMADAQELMNDPERNCARKPMLPPRPPRKNSTKNCRFCCCPKTPTTKRT